MFNLEKYEKLIVLLLVLLLLLVLGISSFQKSRPFTGIKINKMVPDSNIPGAEIPIGVKININTAEARELMQLKGIGETLAGRIVDYRTTNGPFRSPEEILKVKGMSQSLFEKIKDNITAE